MRQAKHLGFVDKRHRSDVGASCKGWAVGGHDDLDRTLPFLRVVRRLLQQLLHSLLQLRMQVCFGLFDKEQCQLIPISEQYKLGGHEKCIVVAEASCTSQIWMNACRRQQAQFKLLKDRLKGQVRRNLDTRLKRIARKSKLPQVVVVYIVLNTLDDGMFAKVMLGERHQANQILRSLVGIRRIKVVLFLALDAPMCPKNL